MSSLLKNILFALGLAVVLWLGYTLFVSNQEEPLLGSTNDLSGDAQVQAQQFLGKLRQIQKYDLSGAVFHDPVFLSLINFREDLGEEPTGRPNPFAPVE